MLTKRQATTVVITLAAIAAAGCGSTSPTVSSSTSSTVTAGASLGTPSATVNATDNLAFDPTTTAVKAGQIVEWDSPGTILHNITFDTQSAGNDANFAAGDKWQVKFSQAGTYTYRCTLHPGMTGTVTVT